MKSAVGDVTGDSNKKENKEKGSKEEKSEDTNKPSQKQIIEERNKAAAEKVPGISSTAQKILDQEKEKEEKAAAKKNDKEEKPKSSDKAAKKDEKKPAKQKAEKLEPMPEIEVDPFYGSTLKMAQVFQKEVKPSFKRQERELYEMATQREGYLQKKSTKLLVGNQRRFYQMISVGAYLCYYDAKPQKDTVPQGIYDVTRMSDF